MIARGATPARVTYRVAADNSGEKVDPGSMDTPYTRGDFSLFGVMIFTFLTT